MGFNQPSFFLQGQSGTNYGARHSAHVDLLGKVTCVGFNHPSQFVQGDGRFDANNDALGYNGTRSPWSGYQRPKNWTKLKWHPGKGLYGDAHVYQPFGRRQWSPWWPGGGRWMVQGEADDNAAHLRWWQQWEGVEHMLGASEDAQDGYYNLYYDGQLEYEPGVYDQPPAQENGAASHFLMGNAMAGSWQEDEAELTGESVNMGGNTEPDGHAKSQISERAFFHGTEIPVTAWSLHKQKHSGGGWSVAGERLASGDGLADGANESYWSQYTGRANGLSPSGDGLAEGANESYWSQYNGRVDGVSGSRNGRRRGRARIGSSASPGAFRPDGQGLAPGSYFMSGYGAVSVPQMWLAGAISATGLPANLSPAQVAGVLGAMVKAEDPRAAEVVERLANDAIDTKHPFSIATLNELCTDCEGDTVVGFVTWSQIARKIGTGVRKAAVKIKSGSKHLSAAMSKAVKALTHPSVSRHLPVARANANRVVPNTGTALALAIKKGDTKLAPGARGGEVTALQKRIAALCVQGSPPVVFNVTGVYDAKTVEFIKQFQESQGLKADGVTDSATLAALSATEEMVKDLVKSAVSGVSGRAAGNTSPFPVDLTPAQAGKVLATLVSSQDRRAAQIVRQTAAKAASGNHASTATLIAMMHQIAAQGVPQGATVAMGLSFSEIVDTAQSVVSTVNSIVATAGPAVSAPLPSASPASAAPASSAIPGGAGGVAAAVASAVKVASGVITSLSPQHVTQAAAGVNVPVPNAGTHLNAALNPSGVQDAATAQAASTITPPPSRGAFGTLASAVSSFTTRPHGDDAHNELADQKADVIVLEMPKPHPWYAMSRYR